MPTTDGSLTTTDSKEGGVAAITELVVLLGQKIKCVEAGPSSTKNYHDQGLAFRTIGNALRVLLMVALTTDPPFTSTSPTQTTT
jgi:hypothetical protein